VVPQRDRVSRAQALKLLRHCDVVFGCTDDHTGRLNLSRLAYWYLVPVIDMGVQISAAEGEIRGIFGRITYLAPGELTGVRSVVLTRPDKDLIQAGEAATWRKTFSHSCDVGVRPEGLSRNGKLPLTHKS
jgi:molybdopterin/thiamine biosynthesis adenylyltransferase